MALLAVIAMASGCSAEHGAAAPKAVSPDNLRLDCVGYSEGQVQAGAARYAIPRDSYSTRLRLGKQDDPVTEQDAAGAHSYCTEASGVTCRRILRDEQLLVDDTSLLPAETANAFERRHVVLTLNLRNLTLTKHSTVERFDLPNGRGNASVEPKAKVENNALLACKRPA